MFGHHGGKEQPFPTFLLAPSLVLFNHIHFPCLQDGGRRCRWSSLCVWKKQPLALHQSYISTSTTGHQLSPRRWLQGSKQVMGATDFFFLICIHRSWLLLSNRIIDLIVLNRENVWTQSEKRVCLFPNPSFRWMNLHGCVPGWPVQSVKVYNPMHMRERKWQIPPCPSQLARPRQYPGPQQKAMT